MRITITSDEGEVYETLTSSAPDRPWVDSTGEDVAISDKELAGLSALTTFPDILIGARNWERANRDG